MNVDDATSVATRLLRRRPAELLPPFLGDAATGIVAQTVGLATLSVALFSLQGTDRIERLVEAVTALTESQEVTGTEIQAVQDALAGLLTPTVTATLAVGAAVGAVAVVVFRAVVGAAKLNAAMVAVRETRDDAGDGTGHEAGTDRRPSVETDGVSLGPLTAAVEGVFADTWRLAGLTVLRGAVLLVPFLLAAVEPLALLLLVPALPFAYVGFLFAAEAVVVDDVGPVGGIRRNLVFLRRDPGQAVLYVVVEVSAYVGLLVLSGVLGVAGVSRVVSVASLFLLLPWLALVRIGVYLPAASAESATGGVTDADHRGRDVGRADEGDEPEGAEDRTTGGPPATADEGATAPWDEDENGKDGSDAPASGEGGPRAVLADLREGLRTGVAELRRFLVAHPGLFAVSLATFVVGTGVGRLLGPSAPAPVTGDPGAVFGAFPLGTAINLTANNWLVAVSGSFAGVALGVPTLANLLFNGLLVGTASGLLESRAFVALVLPHAVVEVPALAVGGALGLQFAREGYGVARGRTAATEFAAELRRGLYVLVGLLPVFLVAGVVEAFVTPAVAGLVVG